jgi:N-acetylglutamate synthase-like GNAT family acetyltransferase
MSLSFHSLEAIRHKAELGVTVHDDYQSQGLGTTMIKHLLEIAQQKGLKKVYSGLIPRMAEQYMSMKSVDSR